MRNKPGKVYQLHPRSGVRRRETQLEHPLLLELSPQARLNLARLQLISLDSQGRQPGPAQVIEKLINDAAGREPDAPYPS